jgi:hypothetical protein
MNKQLIEEISSQQLAIHTDEMTYSAEYLRLIKRCYRSSLLRAVAQSRRDEFLPSMGISLGAIPALATTSPMIPKKHV